MKSCQLKFQENLFFKKKNTIFWPQFLLHRSPMPVGFKINDGCRWLHFFPIFFSSSHIFISFSTGKPLAQSLSLELFWIIFFFFWLKSYRSTGAPPTWLCLSIRCWPFNCFPEVFVFHSDWLTPSLMFRVSSFLIQSISIGLFWLPPIHLIGWPFFATGPFVPLSEGSDTN